MNNQEIIKDVIISLTELSDPKRKELAKSYYPTKMEVLGVKNPDIKMVIKNLKTLLKDRDLRFKIDLAKDLVFTDIFECQQLAYDLIGNDKKLIPALTKEDVDQLNQNQDNWVSVDSYSGYILGVVWRLGIVDDQYILEKTESSDFWIRRQSLVATLGWNQKSRGGTGNGKKTLMICSLFVDDHHDMINKALSWALRELVKRDKQAVIAFMEDFEPRLHGRVRREVWTKIKTGVKNPK